MGTDFARTCLTLTGIIIFFVGLASAVIGGFICACAYLDWPVAMLVLGFIAVVCGAAIATSGDMP